MTLSKELERASMISTLLAFLITFGEANKEVTCPSGYNFTSGNSCFKYVDAHMFQYSSAKTYCEEKLGGQLAVLNSKAKIKSAITFFYSIYEGDSQQVGAPTAWVEGHWEFGTRRVLYPDGRRSHHGHWMTSTRNDVTGDMFRWPNSSIFGRSATCLAISLWRRKSHTAHEISGVYNVPCDSYYWTHALCETKVL